MDCQTLSFQIVPCKHCLPFSTFDQTIYQSLTTDGGRLTMNFCYFLTSHWLNSSSIYLIFQSMQPLNYRCLYALPNRSILFLLSLDMPHVCKHCRPRSVSFSQLIWICTVYHSVCYDVSTTWIKRSDWYTIRNEPGILIYSAWQGLGFMPRC